MSQDRFPYRVFVEWSDEDAVYVARVPAFEGLAAHGDTPEAAALEAHVAAEAMIAVLKRDKRPMPPPDAAGG